MRSSHILMGAHLCPDSFPVFSCIIEHLLVLRAIVNQNK